MTVELISVVTVGTPARKLKSQLEIIGIHTKTVNLQNTEFPLTASVCHLSNIIMESVRIEVSIWRKNHCLWWQRLGIHLTYRKHQLYI